MTPLRRSSGGFRELCHAADTRGMRVLLEATGEKEKARLSKVKLARRRDGELVASVRLGARGVGDLNRASGELLELIDELDRRSR